MDDNRNMLSDNIDHDEWADSFFADVVKGEEKKQPPRGLYGQFEPEADDGVLASGQSDQAAGDKQDSVKDGFVDESENVSKADREKKTSVAIGVAAVITILILAAVCVVFAIVIFKKVRGA